MNRIVKLDVGGCLYTTTWTTLTRYTDSMLAAMLNPGLLKSGVFLRDVNGAYVIDRDGSIFRHVLNFLRQGRLILPEDFKEWDQLELEAEFYQVKALVKAVKAVKEEKVIRKFEFIEIDQAGTYLFVKYIGSSETLEKTPGLLQILNSGTSGTGNDAINDVEIKGIVDVKIKELKPEQKRMSIFREINRNGFKLKTAPCTRIEGDHGVKWTFLRKI